MRKSLIITLFALLLVGATIFFFNSNEDEQTLFVAANQESEKPAALKEGDLFESSQLNQNIESIRIRQIISSIFVGENFVTNIEKIKAEQTSRIEAFRHNVLLAQEVNILLAAYPWGPSTEVKDLQAILGVVVDGVYGESTRTAHISELEIRRLIVDNVPNGTKGIKTATSVNNLSLPEPVEVPTIDCLEETPHLRSCWPGHEGGNEPMIQAAFNNLPGSLRNKIPSDFILVNGCHPFSDRCAYGVMDSQGWGPNGRCCDMPWARSIWISNRGINSGHLNDIMIHEAFHAVEYTTLSRDMRDRLSSEFGDSERAADGAVAYFGGNWQHYRGSGTGLTDSQSALFDEIFR